MFLQKVTSHSHFPDEDQVFRFETYQGYKEVKGLSIKEMDACWYNPSENALYLIELKDWGDGILDEEKEGILSTEETVKLRKVIYKSRLYTLLDKSKNSAFMIAAMLLNTNQGRKINTCAAFTINSSTTFHFINIINWTNTDITPISNMHSLYKTLFSSYRILFNFRTPIILTKAQAMARFDWVT